MATRGAAKAILRSALAAGKEAAKATGQGAKEGIKGAVKNTVREEAKRALRSRFLVPGTSSYTEVPAFQMPSMVPMAPPLVQSFPAYCACDENPRAQKAYNGKRMMMCHRCAPRGMGVGDFKTQYEAGAAPLLGRARPPANYFAHLVAPRNSLIGSILKGSRRVSRSKSRSKSNSKKSSTRKAKSS